MRTQEECNQSSSLSSGFVLVKVWPRISNFTPDGNFVGMQNLRCQLNPRKTKAVC